MTRTSINYYSSTQPCHVFILFYSILQDKPRPMLQMPPSYFVVVMCFICVLHSSSHHSHCIGTSLSSCFKNLHPLVVAASSLSLLTSSQVNRTALFYLFSEPIKLPSLSSNPSRASESCPKPDPGSRDRWVWIIPKHPQNIFGLFFGLS